MRSLTAMKLAVLGAGSWGTAIADLTSHNASEVTLWARRPDLAKDIAATRRNADYLPNVELGSNVTPTSSLTEALGGADVVIAAMPSHGFREVLGQAADQVPSAAPVVSLAKGIEQETLLRMTEVTADVLGTDTAVGVLTGPNLAAEVAAGLPTAAVLAMPDEDQGRELQPLFAGPAFRVYTNPDVVGCEAAGALKNVMAIAAGIAHGLDYGENTLAALLTRALAEITRLGIAMGGERATFAGLAGMGDLIATCMSTKSRNHRVGTELGKGRKLSDVIAEMNMVAEGVRTTDAVLSLAQRHRVEMPIATEVGAVLNDGKDPRELVPELMGRQAKSEVE